MNFFSKLWENTGISGASSGSPLSNYTMGETIATYDPGHRGIWTMKTGLPKKGAAPAGPRQVPQSLSSLPPVAYGSDLSQSSLEGEADLMGFFS